MAKEERIKAISRYVTSDGEEFYTLEEASRHQQEIDNFDYRKAYLALEKEVAELKSMVTILRAGNTFSTLINKRDKNLFPPIMY